MVADRASSRRAPVGLVLTALLLTTGWPLAAAAGHPTCTFGTANGKITTEDGQPTDAFGTVTLLEADRLVTSAPGDDAGAGVDQGAVYVCVRSGASWTLEQKIFANDPGAGDRFGSAMALEGATLAIGARLDVGPLGVSQGSVEVWTRSGSVWSFQQKIFAADPAPPAYHQSVQELFGTALGLTGDTLAIGAQGSPGALSGSVVNVGQVEVWKRSGSTWTRHQRITAHDPADGDIFGASLAIDADTLAIGAHNDDPGSGSNTGDDRGSLEVWTRSGASSPFAFQQKLLSPDGAPKDQFGARPSLEGDTLVVGDYWDDGPTGQDQGSVEVWTRGGSTWSFHQKIFANDPGAGDLFGFAALDGNVLAVGALRDDASSGADQGSVELWSRSGPGATFAFSSKVLAIDPAASDSMGQSVALQGTTLAVSVHGDGAGRGSVFLGVAPSTTPTVTVSADAMSGASETGPTSAPFRISRSGSTAAALTVSFTLGGTAVAGSDHALSGTASPTSAVLPAGAASIDLPVVPVDDTQVEGAETVVLTLSPGDYTIGSPGAATITIADNDVDALPTVTLSLRDSPMPERDGRVAIVATLSRSTNVAVIVHVAYSGTASPADYTHYIHANDSIFLGPTALTSEMSIWSRDDDVYDPDETIVVDIASVTNATELGTQRVIAVILDDEPHPPTPSMPTPTPTPPPTPASTPTPTASPTPPLPATPTPPTPPSPPPTTTSTPATPTDPTTPPIATPPSGGENRPPVFDPHPTRVSVPEGGTIALGVAATDPDGDVVTIVAEFTDRPPGDPSFQAPEHVLAWTPPRGTSREAPYPVRFTATDGRGGEARIEIELVVTDGRGRPGGDAPPATCDPSGRPAVDVNVSSIAKAAGAVRVILVCGEPATGTDILADVIVDPSVPDDAPITLDMGALVDARPEPTVLVVDDVVLRRDSAVAANGFELAFAPGTRIGSSDPEWDGTLTLPRLLPSATVRPPGGGLTRQVVEVGRDDSTLRFDRPARLLFPRAAGQQVGVQTFDGSASEIVTTCDSATAPTNVPPAGQCKADVAEGLVVWTAHSGTFFTFSLSSPAPAAEATAARLDPGPPALEVGPIALGGLVLAMAVGSLLFLLARRKRRYVVILEAWGAGGAKTEASMADLASWLEREFTDVVPRGANAEVIVSSRLTSSAAVGRRVAELIEARSRSPVVVAARSVGELRAACERAAAARREGAREVRLTFQPEGEVVEPDASTPTPMTRTLEVVQELTRTAG